MRMISFINSHFIFHTFVDETSQSEYSLGNIQIRFSVVHVYVPIDHMNGTEAAT